MKKTFKILPLLLVALSSFSFTACSDDEDIPMEITVPEYLPDTAQNFIDEYFPDENVTLFNYDGEDYAVILSGGSILEFNKTGNWKSVSAPENSIVPTGYYAQAIDYYVSSTRMNDGINSILRDNIGYYNVSLLSGKSLRFSAQGTYIGEMQK